MRRSVTATSPVSIFPKLEREIFISAAKACCVRPNTFFLRCRILSDIKISPLSTDKYSTNENACKGQNVKINCLTGTKLGAIMSLTSKEKEAKSMTEKQKQTLERFEKLMKTMTDRELENLLLVGEGMVIMAGIKEKQGAAKKSA